MVTNSCTKAELHTEQLYSISPAVTVPSILMGICSPTPAPASTACTRCSLVSTSVCSTARASSLHSSIVGCGQSVEAVLERLKRWIHTYA